ncbi:MAG: DUF1697 domain-containing protein [Anaerolineales bacterium]|nr:DUF1697 domain-containing protein [Anaerolineales bacterium]
MPRYAALLRGINLGKRTVKMAELREALSAAGYEDVRTLLASGNVVLSSPQADAAALTADLEQTIQAAFGFEVPVILRSTAEIAALVASDPFAGVPVDKNTRLYISFLAEPPAGPLPAELQAGDGQFRLLDVQPGHVVSAVQLDASRGTLNLMDALGKHFGAGITTRNWNTVLKVHAAMEGP